MKTTINFQNLLGTMGVVGIQLVRLRLPTREKVEYEREKFAGSGD